MAIAARPKPKAYLRKRQAQHHRVTKHYLKPYWPYLPMAIIVLCGVALNKALDHHSSLGVANAGQPSLISSGFLPTDAANTRIQQLVGNQSHWIVWVTLAITIAALTYIIVSHGNRMRRVIQKSESYIIRHPRLEIALVAVCTTGFLLTRIQS